MLAYDGTSFTIPLLILTLLLLGLLGVWSHLRAREDEPEPEIRFLVYGTAGAGRVWVVRPGIELPYDWRLDPDLS